MQSPVPRPSRNSPGFIPLPRLDSDIGGWRTPTSASTATSPWDDGSHNPYADVGSSSGRPHLRPLRLSLLQTRMDSASSVTANAPESPQPLSPRRLDRSEGSALGIIVPPGTPPAEALPRWLVDRRFSKQKSLLSGHRTPSRWPEPYSPFESTFNSATPVIDDWRANQPLVRTPEPLPLPIIEGLRTPEPRDEFPFDLDAVSGERVRTPGGPMMRPRPLPRTSSDDTSDRRLFRVNVWGEHESPRNASTGLFSLMQTQGPLESRAQSRPRRLPSRLASTAPSPIPSPPL